MTITLAWWQIAGLILLILILAVISTRLVIPTALGLSRLWLKHRPNGIKKSQTHSYPKKVLYAESSTLASDYGAVSSVGDDEDDDRNKPFSDMLKRSEIEYRAETQDREMPGSELPYEKRTLRLDPDGTFAFVDRDDYPEAIALPNPFDDSTEFSGTTGFAPGGVSWYGGEPIPRKMKRRKWFGRNK